MRIHYFSIFWLILILYAPLKLNVLTQQRIIACNIPYFIIKEYDNMKIRYVDEIKYQLRASKLCQFNSIEENIRGCQLRGELRQLDIPSDSEIFPIEYNKKVKPNPIDGPDPSPKPSPKPGGNVLG